MSVPLRSASPHVSALAAGCILPSFAGSEPPDWLRRWLGLGLAGVVLFGRNVCDPAQVAELTGAMRRERPGLVVAVDEEGGEITRLEAAAGSSYPGSFALGVVDDIGLTERVAGAIAGDLAAAGMTMNLAPVADVNTNPDNPVIGIRSFGSDPALVGRHVAAFVRGLQRHGVAACAKHFPGHGDTAVDSHLGTAVVHVSRDELAAGPLLPFRAAIAAGVRAIMTAHVVVPALDDVPATLSAPVLTRLLRAELGFAGAVLTDALDMRGVSRAIPIEECAVRALAAGADGLCLGPGVDAAGVARVHAAIVAAIRSGRLAEEQVGEAAARVGRTAADLPAWPTGDGTDRSIGVTAARRAVRSYGTVEIDAPPVVVELAADAAMVVDGAGLRFGNVVRGRWPTAEVRTVEALGDVARLELSSGVDGRPLVVVLRDGARHAWQREAATALVATGNAVVVETGLPGWLPPDVPAIETNGVSRVSYEAAVELLAG